MSTKLHSGLKRTLAWLLTAAMLAQGCFVVSADDFSSEPAAAQETQADTQSDAKQLILTQMLLKQQNHQTMLRQGKKRLLPRT